MDLWKTTIFDQDFIHIFNKISILQYFGNSQNSKKQEQIDLTSGH